MKTLNFLKNFKEKLFFPNLNTNLFVVLQRVPASLTQPTTSISGSSSRRTCNILLNLTRNKLSLMSLCAQYVEPNDLDLFNEFYTSILCSITSIMLNLNLQPQADNLQQQQQIGGSFDSIEIINLKFSIILQLLEKFSFVSLEKLIAECRDNQRR